MSARLWIVAGVVVSALIVVSGCRATPAFNGDPIAGNCVATGCPSGMRCIAGACLTNTIPTVGPFDLFTFVYGTDIDIRLTDDDWQDADDSALTFVWTQVDNGAPELIAAPAEGDRLLITKPPLGSYVFEVVGEDGFDPSQPAVVSISVANSIPTVAPSYLEFRLVDDALLIDAQATDADPGHGVEITWETVVAPAGVVWTIADDELTITLSVVGTYVFAATPRDFLVDSLPREYIEQGETGVYQIVVEPEPDVTYVNGGFRLEPGATPGPCGEFTQPCLTVAKGIAAAALRTGVVHVAALPAMVAYDECLDFAGDEQIVGGFDPDSWESPAPTSPEQIQRRTILRARTEIRCNQPDGHEVTGNGSLSDLTLTSSVPDGESAYTLQVSGARIAPTFHDIDVVGAACGDSCDAIAILSAYTDARFFGVDVTAPQVGLSILANFVGYMLVGGTPILSAEPYDPLSSPPRPATRTADDGLRGTITLAAPVTNSAIGLLTYRSDAILRRLYVRGGLGATLAAVGVVGGALTIELSLFEISALGTHSLSGVNVDDCETDLGCDCTLTPIDLCTGPNAVVGAREAVVLVADNYISLKGGDEGGQIPCMGAGIAIQTSMAGHTVSNNRVELRGLFHLAVGLVIGGGGGGTGVDRILDNQVVVDGGKTEWACFYSGGGAIGSEFVGVFGAAVYGTAVEFSGQTIEVGAHDWSSTALIVGAASALRIENNILLGAADRGPVDTAAEGIGAVLLSADATVAPSVFINNTVQMGNGAVTSVGVMVDASPWYVANNFIYGGTTYYSTGLLIETRQPDVGWPQIVHNTIHGGGDPLTTLRSRAVVIDSGVAGNTWSFPNLDSGVLRNNLIDAGDAGGRRYLLDRLDRGYIDAAAGNVSQVVGEGTGLNPVLAIADRDRVVGKIAVDLIIAGAGELVSLRQSGGLINERRAVTTYGPVATAWAGVVDGDDWTVVGRAGHLAVAKGRAAAQEFVAVSIRALVNDALVEPTPAGVVAGEYDGKYPADLVFVTRAASGAGAGLWLVPGRLDGGFGVAAPIDDLLVEDPLMVAVPVVGSVTPPDTSGSTDLFFVVDRTSDTAGLADGLDLYVLPSGHIFDLAVALGRLDIDQLLVVDLGIDMSGFSCSSGNSRLSYDLVIVSGGQLLVYLQPCLDPTLPAAIGYIVGNDPCNGVTERVAISNGETLRSAQYPEIWLGCADGSIEVYWFVFVAGVQLARMAATAGAVPGTIGAFTASAAIPDGAGGFDDAGDLFVASEVDMGAGVAPQTRVQVFEIVETAPFVFALNEVASASLIDQVATRTNSFRPVVTFTPMGFPSAPVTAGNECALVGREGTGGAGGAGGTGGYDLHLYEPGGVAMCKDTGDPLTSTEIGIGLDVDIDGYDARTNLPDVGADELP